jgi:hypothetical protein
MVDLNLAGTDDGFNGRRQEDGRERLNHLARAS